MVVSASKDLSVVLGKSLQKERVMIPEILDGIGKMILFLCLALLVALPFAIWKLVELINWIVTHVQIVD